MKTLKLTALGLIILGAYSQNSEASARDVEEEIRYVKSRKNGSGRSAAAAHLKWDAEIVRQLEEDTPGENPYNKVRASVSPTAAIDREIQQHSGKISGIQANIRALQTHIQELDTLEKEHRSRALQHQDELKDKEQRLAKNQAEQATLEADSKDKVKKLEEKEKKTYTNVREFFGAFGIPLLEEKEPTQEEVDLRQAIEGLSLSTTPEGQAPYKAKINELYGKHIGTLQIRSIMAKHHFKQDPLPVPENLQRPEIRARFKIIDSLLEKIAAFNKIALENLLGAHQVPEEIRNKFEGILASLKKLHDPTSTPEDKKAGATALKKFFGDNFERKISALQEANYAEALNTTVLAPLQSTLKDLDAARRNGIGEAKETALTTLRSIGLPENVLAQDIPAIEAKVQELLTEARNTFDTECFNHWSMPRLPAIMDEEIKAQKALRDSWISKAKDSLNKDTQEVENIFIPLRKTAEQIENEMEKIRALIHQKEQDANATQAQKAPVHQQILALEAEKSQVAGHIQKLERDKAQVVAPQAPQA